MSDQTYRAYKFVIQPVIHALDGDGNVVAEAATNQVTVFGCDQLAKWAEEFDAKLATADIQTAETPE